MSEENRKRALSIYSHTHNSQGDQDVDIAELVDIIEKALDEAQRRGAEEGFLEGQKQMQERAAEKVWAIGKDSDDPHHHIAGIARGVVLALPLEGPKDGK